MASPRMLCAACSLAAGDVCSEHSGEKSTSNRSADCEEVHETIMDLKAAGLSGVVKTAKSLVTNGPYMFSVLYGTFDAIIVNGFVAFGAKYFQQQFTLTAAMASIIFGWFFFVLLCCLFDKRQLSV